MSAVAAPLLDLFVAFLVFVGLMVWFGLAPTWRLLTLPLLVLLALLTAFAASLWLSALHAKYRDIGHTIPFLLQLWMYVSPVAYPTSLVPARWRLLYTLNPLTNVLDGFRWALVGAPGPQVGSLLLSSVVLVSLLASGLIFFARLERSLADIV